MAEGAKKDPTKSGMIRQEIFGDAKSKFSSDRPSKCEVVQVYMSKCQDRRLKDHSQNLSASAKMDCCKLVCTDILKHWEDKGLPISSKDKAYKAKVTKKISEICTEYEKLKNSAKLIGKPDKVKTKKEEFQIVFEVEPVKPKKRSFEEVSIDSVMSVNMH